MEDLKEKLIKTAKQEEKVYCNDCEYNSYLTCNKFNKKKKECEFTNDNELNYTFKSDLNPDGKCKHYQKKTNFLYKLTKKLWEK